MKKRILLLATGGTIASLLSDHGLKPGLNADQILSFIPEIKEECDVDAVQVCNSDSTNMSPDLSGTFWIFPAFLPDWQAFLMNFFDIVELLEYEQ